MAFNIVFIRNAMQKKMKYKALNDAHHVSYCAAATCINHIDARTVYQFPLRKCGVLRTVHVLRIGRGGPVYDIPQEYCKTSVFKRNNITV